MGATLRWEGGRKGGISVVSPWEESQDGTREPVRLGVCPLTELWLLKTLQGGLTKHLGYYSVL